ncbi:MAG: flagellar hook protein FlgE [Bacteroidota bacterium]
MIRSLRTGISGLRNHQVRMDVIGNNIANVNTVAFKRSRVAFNELLGQKLLGLGRSAGGQGVNPATVGNGVAVASIDQDWNVGSFENTSIGTDLALAGDGFFIAEGIEGNVLTRAGNFRFNAAGNLVTSGGLAVQGWAFAEDGTLNTGQLQDIYLDLDATASPVETANVRLSGNLSADIDATSDDNEVTRTSVIHDAQGKAHTLVMTMRKTDVDEWEIASVEIAGDPDAEPPVPPTALTVSAGTIEFDTDGNLVAPDPATFDITGTFPDSAGDDVAITLDIGDLTQYGGSTTAAVSEQDGQAAGRVISYGINPSGILTVGFSNGEQRSIAQLAIGTVNNPGGLEQLGENFYGATSVSGDLLIGRAGQEVVTSVVAGALEASNVDLATEFTEMIVTQRGYQASARVITTSDELLQEVVQLKR